MFRKRRVGTCDYVLHHFFDPKIKASKRSRACHSSGNKINPFPWTLIYHMGSVFDKKEKRTIFIRMSAMSCLTYTSLRKRNGIEAFKKQKDSF